MVIIIIFVYLRMTINSLEYFSGGGMRSKTDFSIDSLTVLPFTLFPSVFPRVQFQKAVAIQPALNELTHRVSNDYAFLYSCLEKYCTFSLIIKSTVIG